MTNLSVIYYSSTGSVHTLAEAVAKGAGDAGAEVRLRRVAETAPAEAIEQNPAWKAHLQATSDVQTATADDVLWADAVVFGTPTRYGNVSAQLKSFLDSLGPQWQAGELADRVYAGFVSTATAHGGQESTLLALYNTIHHFGGIIASPGYTDPSKFVDGNPYGASHVSANGENPPQQVDLDAAAYTGKRAAMVAGKLRG